MRFTKNKEQRRQKYQKRRTRFNIGSSKNARALPFFLKLSVMLSGVMPIISISFVVIGGICFAVFMSVLDFQDLSFSSSDPKTKGKLLQINSTNSFENEKRVFEYTFTFKDEDGNSYDGYCYTTGNVNFQDSIVDIQYLKNDPETSRIIGTRKGLLSFWIIIFLAIFPLIGIITMFFSINNGIKKIRILKYGKLGYGRFINMEATGSKINEQTIYRLFFKFTDEEGNEHTAIGETHKVHKLTDEEEEPLVYDQNNPENAVMLDALPSVVRRFFLKT